MLWIYQTQPMWQLSGLQEPSWTSDEESEAEPSPEDADAYEEEVRRKSIPKSGQSCGFLQHPASMPAESACALPPKQQD